jgi:hypothetical protein
LKNLQLRIAQGLTSMLKLIEIVRSLGFGALLGSGVLGLLHVRYADAFPADADLFSAILVGALLGAGVQRAVEAWIVNSVLRPSVRLTGYYFKLAQLSLLRRLAIITKKQHAGLVKDLTNRYFADDDPDHHGRNESQEQRRVTNR